MSMITASSVAPQPHGVDPQPARRLQPLTGPSSQRRRRPTALYALTAVTVLFGVVALQLILSIALAQGAFHAERLENRSAQLDRDLQVAEGQLQQDAAPQNLAAQAAEMGMVSDSVPVYLRLSDSTVIGAPQGADADTTKNLIPNALLAGGTDADADAATDEPGQSSSNPPDTQGMGVRSKDAAAGQAGAGASTQSADKSGGDGVSDAESAAPLKPYTGTLPAPSTH